MYFHNKDKHLHSLESPPIRGFRNEENGRKLEHQKWGKVKAVTLAQQF